MKNSDMKVIAIILSIALLITIITSNAVSVASVILLSNGGVATESNGDGTQTGTNVGGSTVSTGGSTVSTGGSSTSTGGSSTSTGGSSASTGGSSASTGNNASTPAGNTGNQGGAASNDQGNTADNTGATPEAVLKEYQDAVKAIREQGAAGYNKKGWQKILKIEGLGMLDSVVVPIIQGFMTTEDQATVKENAKGSEDATNRLAVSNCSIGTVKSCTKNGNTITIVMNEETNPSYDGTDGIAVMSKEFLDYKDVEKEAKNISIVKSLEGQIVYRDYTITAEMTNDGKFVKITHWGVGYISATLNGSINATGELEFNAVYTDFAY